MFEAVEGTFSMFLLSFFENSFLLHWTKYMCKNTHKLSLMKLALKVGKFSDQLFWLIDCELQEVKRESG